MEVATAQQLSNSAGAAVSASQQQQNHVRPASAPRGLTTASERPTVGTGQQPGMRGDIGGSGGMVEIPTAFSRGTGSAAPSASLLSLRATREAFAEASQVPLSQQQQQQHLGLRSGSSSLFSSPSAAHRSGALQPRSMLEGKMKIGLNRVLGTQDFHSYACRP